jgi:hypothetical protein
MKAKRCMSGISITQEPYLLLLVSVEQVGMIVQWMHAVCCSLTIADYSTDSDSNNFFDFF